MSVDIVAMGYLFNERIVWPDGKEQGPVPGSTASYGSVALGRLEAKAGIVSVVGEETSRKLLSPILECGIDLRGLEFRKGASEVCNVLRYFPDGTKELKYLKISPAIQYEDIPEDYLDAKVFHLCLVDYEVPLETIGKIRRRSPGALITADLGGAGGAHSREETRSAYLDTENGRYQREYLRNIDIGKISLEDARKSFRREFASPREAAEAYLEAGVGMVVVTLGEDGACILEGEGREITIRAVTAYRGVADTTGAGDTYITAFVAAYVESRDAAWAAWYASATSSLMIEETGGVQIQRMPTDGQVRERLRTYFTEERPEELEKYKASFRRDTR